MEENEKLKLEQELLTIGIKSPGLSLLEDRLSKFNNHAEKLVKDIALYGRNIPDKDKVPFYEQATKCIDKYEYPETAIYLSDKLFSNRNTIRKLRLFGEDYISAYVNFIDIGYKRSKGIEFLDKVFSARRLSEKKLKDMVREDVKERDIKELIPKVVLANIY